MQKIKFQAEGVSAWQVLQVWQVIKYDSQGFSRWHWSDGTAPTVHPPIDFPIKAEGSRYKFSWWL